MAEVAAGKPYIAPGPAVSPPATGGGGGGLQVKNLVNKNTFDGLRNAGTTAAKGGKIIVEDVSAGISGVKAVETTAEVAKKAGLWSRVASTVGPALQTLQILEIGNKAAGKITATNEYIRDHGSDTFEQKRTYWLNKGYPTWLMPSSEPKPRDEATHPSEGRAKPEPMHTGPVAGGFAPTPPAPPSGGGTPAGGSGGPKGPRDPKVPPPTPPDALKERPTKAVDTPQGEKTRVNTRWDDPTKVTETPLKGDPTKVMETPLKGDPTKVTETPLKGDPTKVMNAPDMPTRARPSPDGMRPNYARPMEAVAEPTTITKLPEAPASAATPKVSHASPSRWDRFVTWLKS